MVNDNLVKVFEKSIKKNWALPALTNYKGKSYTYGEVGITMLKIHKIFEDLGVNPGDKISLIGKNSAQWGIIYLSTITYGASIVPILSDFHPDNVKNIVDHSDSVLLFAGDLVWPVISKNNFDNVKACISIENLEILRTCPGFDIETISAMVNKAIFTFEDQNISETSFELPDVKNSNVGVISYTSGTTGFSKGVMLPLQSLMANIWFAWNNMPLERGDNLLSILPMAHAYGCAFEFLWPFTIGVHITFLGKIGSPQTMIDAFKEVKPRLLLMVPLILEKIYKKKLLPILKQPKMQIMLNIPLLNKIIYKKMRAALTETFGGNFREVVIGGAALNRDVELFLRKIKFNFSVGYGMTECGPLISYANWDKTYTGSCGRVVDTLQMKIDSPDPENISGEILVKGDNVMLGYYKNQTETDKVIDNDGWLHTGDLGVQNTNNFVYIHGRSKSMILGPSGENIYPEEIESKLSNYPYIQEQLVVSENNKLVALVFPDLEKVNKEGIKEQELAEIMENTKKMLNSSLPKYSQISEIKLQLVEFEKTPKQSIKRYKYENLQN